MWYKLLMDGWTEIGHKIQCLSNNCPITVQGLSKNRSCRDVLSTSVDRLSTISGFARKSLSEESLCIKTLVFCFNDRWDEMSIQQHELGNGMFHLTTQPRVNMSITLQDILGLWCLFMTVRHFQTDILFSNKPCNRPLFEHASTSEK